MKIIFKIMFVLIPTIALITSGTYGLFTSSANGESNPFQAGSVQVQAYYGCGCGLGEDDPTQNNFTNLTSNASRSGSFSVENTGSLDAWVRYQTQSPLPNIPLTIDYSITVYGPDDSTSSTDKTNKDSNGDLHSNCHTGSKWRGAGGEDKAEIQIGNTITGTFVSGDTSYSKPFPLPSGDFAIITYKYSVPKLDKSQQNIKGQLNMNIQAVQYTNNVKINSDGTTSPIDWQPQKQASTN